MQQENDQKHTSKFLSDWLKATPQNNVSDYAKKNGQKCLYSDVIANYCNYLISVLAAKVGRTSYFFTKNFKKNQEGAKYFFTACQ